MNLKCGQRVPNSLAKKGNKKKKLFHLIVHNKYF